MFREIKRESEDRTATIQDDRIPPFRSLNDFISNAAWNIPDFSDIERFNNRIVNNLIYYQTNYFIFAIALMLLLGLFSIRDFIIGIGVLIAFIFGYIFILGFLRGNGSTLFRRHPNNGKTTFAILYLCVIIYMGVHYIYPLMIVALNILIPILGVLIHAMLRKRNIGNKMANQLEKVKLGKTPMGRFLAAIGV